MYVCVCIYISVVNILFINKSLKSEFITKQACRDENVVSLFIFPYNNIYKTLYFLCIEHCTTEKSKHRLTIYIYIYIYLHILVYIDYKIYEIIYDINLVLNINW